MLGLCVFFFKQKTAYEMRISDWSSDVCSSDLLTEAEIRKALAQMSVRPRPEIGAASATAATKAHDHAEHDHAEGEHEHTHGGIFGANHELIFALICGGAHTTGFAIEQMTTAPAWLPLACSLVVYVLCGWFHICEEYAHLRLKLFEIDTLLPVECAAAGALGG